jgi:hypothetical protein
MAANGGWDLIWRLKGSYPLLQKEVSVCLSAFGSNSAKGSRERSSNFGSTFRKSMRCAVPKTNIIDPWESRHTTDN